VPLRRARRLEETTAVLLVGGSGTRLRGVLGQRPKALASVHGRPFLGYLLAELSGNGLGDVLLCTGHGADEVERYAAGHVPSGMKIRFSREREPLGTAGALRNARDLIHSTPFLAMNGDSFLKTPLMPFFEEHLRHGALASLLLARVGDRSRYGSVRLGEDFRILSFEEKGAAGGGLVNAGIYVLEISVVDRITPARPESLERDVLPTLIGHGLFGFVVDAPFIDIGTPESLEEAERFFA
jgi:NDP-sugar pyrophosphorylase family protein